MAEYQMATTKKKTDFQSKRLKDINCMEIGFGQDTGSIFLG